MRLLFPLVLVSLLQLASAVLLEDAFVRDWTRHWIGHITDFELQDTNSVIGITDQNQLFSANINAQGNASELVWRISLPHQELKFFVNSNLNKVYTYSIESKQVNVWDLQSGILETTLVLKAEPIELVNFFNRGVLLVELDGSVELLPSDLAVQPQLVIYQIPVALSSSSPVFSSVRDGTIYVATLGKIFAIDGAGSSTKTISFTSTNDIVDMKENLIVSEKSASSGQTLLKINEDNTSVSIIKTGISVIDRIILINSDYIAVYGGGAVASFKILKINHSKNTVEEVEGIPETSNTTVGNVHHATASINDFLIIGTSNETILLDITGLLSDDDSSSVETIIFSKPPMGDILKLDYDAHDKIVLVSAFRQFELDIVVTKITNPDETIVKSVIVKSSDYFKTNSQDYIIIDKPSVDSSVLDHAQDILDEEQNNNFLFAWYMRVQRHAIEFVELIFSGGIKSSSSESTVSFGLEKLIVFYDESKSTLVAVDSNNGELFWTAALIPEQFIKVVKFKDDQLLVIYKSNVVSINLRNGDVISLYPVDDITKVVTFNEIDEDGQEESIVLGISSRVQVLGSEGVIERKFLDDKYFVERATGSGYKLSKDLKLNHTWKLPIDANEQIISVVGVSSDVVPSGDSLGIVLSDKSVLYKYLNPNIASVITHNSKLDQVTIYIVDIITGAVLFEQHHTGELVDPASIQITMDNNWIVYTYFSINPRAEQRIVVIDLFDTGIPNDKSEASNNTIGQISTKSFLYPEKILKIGHSYTKFGITTKTIIFLTDSGSLVQIPKFILNSRRISDREFTQKDSQDDFRLSPYEPLIVGGDVNNDKFYHVLNHKRQFTIQPNSLGEVLSIGTELESTSIVCYLNNLDWFCTSIQPSLQYDTLGSNFAKTKLLITIACLLLGVLITKPMVASKRLNRLWLDRP